MEENSKEFEAVMKEITSGFTGEFTEDFTYLQADGEIFRSACPDATFQVIRCRVSRMDGLRIIVYHKNCGHKESVTN